MTSYSNDRLGANALIVVKARVPLRLALPVTTRRSDSVAGGRPADLDRERTARPWVKLLTVKTPGDGPRRDRASVVLELASYRAVASERAPRKRERACTAGEVKIRLRVDPRGLNVGCAGRILDESGRRQIEVRVPFDVDRAVIDQRRLYDARAAPGGAAFQGLDRAVVGKDAAAEDEIRRVTRPNPFSSESSRCCVGTADVRTPSETHNPRRRSTVSPPRCRCQDVVRLRS